MNIDSEVLKVLACPACLGSLKLVDKFCNPISDNEDVSPRGQADQRIEKILQLAGLLCSCCSLVYPVSGGISLLLKESGINIDKWGVHCGVKADHD